MALPLSPLISPLGLTGDREGSVQTVQGKITPLYIYCYYYFRKNFCTIEYIYPAHPAQRSAAEDSGPCGAAVSFGEIRFFALQGISWSQPRDSRPHAALAGRSSIPYAQGAERERADCAG